MVTQAWQTKGGSHLREMIASILSAGDPLGCTADEIADELHMPLDGMATQHMMEDMVMEGVLDRRGVGRGALYTLARPVRLSKGAAASHAGPDVKGPLVSKVG